MGCGKVKEKGVGRVRHVKCEKGKIMRDAYMKRVGDRMYEQDNGRMGKDGWGWE